MYKSILHFTLVAVALLVTGTAMAQQTCPTDQAVCLVDNNEFLNRVVNGDTTATGDRARADRIYELGRGNLYVMDETIRNSDYHLRIYGEEGDGALPQIYTTVNATSGNRVGNVFEQAGDITFRNFAFAGVIEDAELNPDGNATMSVTFIRVTQPGFDLVIDNVTAVNIVAQFVRAQSSLRKFEMTNSIWANSGYLGTNGTNFGAGKGIDLRDGSIDSLIFRNNTFVNYTDRIIRHRSSTGPVDNMIFDHNTVIDAVSYHGMMALGQVGTSVQITNNLFVDAFAAGADTSDVVRQSEFDESGEVYASNGQAKMTWILSEPNETTNWNITNNIYTVSDDLEAFYATYGDGGGDDGNPDNGTDGDNDIIGAGDPLTDHIQGRISNPTDAFVEMDLELTDRPAPPIDMLTWYHEETGRTKETTTFVDAEDDYNRRTFEYFLNDFDASYPMSSAAYTAAEGDCPVGDLNWFPGVNVQACIDASTGIEYDPTEIPAAYQLEQNYPNPFNPTTNISYALPNAARVSLVVYNVLGQEVATLVKSQQQGAGSYQVTWSGTDMNGQKVASGVYLYRLNAGETVVTKRMVLVK
ncbi:MAG TPA: T9SS type A sorting domain-containing protein [Rhodothermales bacterium]|nr:T9SS type A sorting domain-containing protein [Rhodothermales bacterium]